MDETETNCGDTDSEYLPDTVEKEIDATMNQVALDKKRHTKVIWQFYTKVPPDAEKIARCSVCKEIKSFRSTLTNLKSHLKQHPKTYKKYLELFEIATNEEAVEEKTNKGDADDVIIEKDSSAVQSYRRNSRSNSSNVWKFFTKVSPLNQKLARCNYCNQLRSFRSTTSNLRKHIMTKHKDIDLDDDSYVENYITHQKTERTNNPRKKRKSWEFLEYESDKSENGDADGLNGANDTVKFSSEIWRHFDVEEEEALCGLCREAVSSTLEDMKNHLEEKHASVLDSITAKVLEAASEEDVFGEDDMYTEVVYLDSETQNILTKPERIQKKRNKQFTKQIPKISKIKTERRGSASSDEVVVKSKHKKHIDESNKKDPDELEMFLNYITVLLKKVPQESSQKLHLDIINLIMNATQSQNKIIIETVNFNNANNLSKELEKSIIVSQSDNNTGDSNNDVRKVITLQNLRPQDDETNTVLTAQIT